MPFGNKKQIKEWTENIPDLDDVFSLKTYEQLESIINAWLNGDDADNEDDKQEVTTTFTRTNNTKKEKKEASDSFDKIDDAFADLGGDLPF